MARGDQVRLPHGRGIGIVIDCADSMANVFVGRKADGSPIIDEYVECELMLTGKHYSRVARQVVSQLRSTAGVR